MPPLFQGAAIQEPNAAEIYRKVFGWAESLRAEDSERLRKAATIKVDDRHLVDLRQQAAPALDAIREAAAISRCHWETETLTCDNLGKGHLNVSVVNLIRVACLSARLHARSGRGRDALDDVFAGLTLAHRIGTGGVLFARVLECAGEVCAFQTLGQILPGLNHAAVNDLSRRLDVLPPPEQASATIGPESRFILESLRAKFEAMGPLIAGTKWGELGFRDEEAATLQRLTGGDREKLLAHLEATAPAFAELARRLDLPRPRCRAALDEFALAERSTHPVAAGLVQNAWGIRHVVDRMCALRSMLRAGILLVRGGEPAFRAEPDPFGSGPFRLDRRGKGSLIRSALRDEGKPDVSLEIGETV
jgi:hypothetical protein